MPFATPGGERKKGKEKSREQRRPQPGVLIVYKKLLRQGMLKLSARYVAGHEDAAIISVH